MNLFLLQAKMKIKAFIGFIFLLGIGEIFAHPGIGIVEDSQGNIYYTDLTHVWKISQDGRHTIAVPDVHTHELFIDANDNLYGEHEWYQGEATDTWVNYTWRLSNEGVFTKLKEVEGFLENNTLVRDEEGASYWSKNQDDYQLIYRQTGNGSTLLSSHHFNNIRWMYYSQISNHLLVIDNLSIKQVLPSGEVVVVSNNLKDETLPFAGVADHHYLYGLWTDAHGVIYVAVFGASKVKMVNREGDVSTFYESEAGWSPCGGLVATDGTHWVMEFSEDNKTRVTRIP